MEVIFRFSEVTLKSEMAELSFFSLLTTSLLPLVASVSRAAADLSS